MYKYLVYILLAIVLFSSACQEEEKNLISGNITDMSSDENVAGVTVKLYVSELTSGSVNTNFKEFMTTTTDASGNYSFEFDSKNVVEYRINFSKDAYHTQIIQFDPVDVVGTYLKNEKIARESYLFVKLLNTAPNSESDQLKIRVLGVDELCSTCCDGNMKYFLGDLVDTSFICPVVGGDSIRLEIISIHGDQTINSTIKRYCIPSDTVFYNCYY